MECSEKPVFYNYTGQELAQIRIMPPDEAVRKLVKKHWDTLAKPLDGMGSFESITAQIGAILGTEVIDIHKKGVLIFCAVPLPQESDWYGSVRKRTMVSLPPGKWESATPPPAVQ